MWLVSYLVVFMLPFISGIFVHFEAVNIINDQNTQKAEQIISFEQSEINQLYDMCHTTYVSLLQNSNVTDVMSMMSPEQLSGAKAYELKNDLSRMLLEQNYIIKDIWIAFNNIDYCASTQRIVSLSDFLAAEGIMEKPLVTSENINKTYNGILMRTSNELVYFKTLGYSANKNVINMVLIVDENLFIEKIHKFIPKESGIMMLYNSENQLIFSSSDVSETFSEQAKNISENDFKVRIDGEKFIISSSNLYGIKYVYLISERALSQPLRVLKIIIALTALFSVFAGIWLIYYLLKRNVQPVNDIMHMLGSIRYEANEFDTIKDKIKLYNKERNSLNRKINLFKPLALNNLIYSLTMYGDMDRYAMGHLNIHLDCKYFILTAIDIDNMGVFFEGEDEDLIENNQQLMMVAVTNIFTELLEKTGNVFCGLLQDKIVVLINSDEDFSSLIHECMVKGCELINQHLNITAYLAQGATTSSMEEIPKIYSSIQEQLENMRIAGEHGVEFCDTAMENCNILTNDKKASFVQYIFDTDFDKANETLLQVLSSSAPKVMMRYFVSDMFVEAAREITRKTGNEVDVVGILRLITETPNLRTIESQLAEHIKRLCVVSSDLSDSFETKVYELINRDFRNPNLNITMIAFDFQITPAYLSYKFRERYHINILDYIGSLRIEYAKHLLLETDETMEEIYLKCGYSSRSTFVRQFKKYTDFTPGKFKQLYS